jgi:hypothetical protein
VSDQARSQEAAEDAAEPCDPVHCYQTGPIPLTLDDGTEVDFDLRSSVPVVNGDAVSLLPGATVFLKGDEVDGMLINFRPVPEPADLKDVVKLRMWQEPGMPDTYLRVTNYFHELLKYQAAMLLPQAENFRSTSSCAVLGDGRAGYEHWPHAILQLVLVDFVFMRADAAEVTCQ